MTSRLIITADDFGYRASYDAGILEAVLAGAVDAVSVMAKRLPSLPVALTGSGVALGVHLEEGDPRAQIDRFTGLAGRPPDYIDGHHHCHATAAVTSNAAAAGLPVRSIDTAHRRRLREAGVRTPDLLIGRLSEDEPARPAELDKPLPGWTEWMVHPGHPAGEGGSGYDAGRGEDLRVLLELELPEGVSRSDQRSLPPPS